MTFDKHYLTTRRILLVALLILSSFVVNTACSDPWKLPKLGLPSKIPFLTKVPEAKEHEKSRVQNVALALRLPSIAVLHLLLAAESTAVTASKFSVDPTSVIATTNMMVHCVWHIANEEKDMELLKFLHRHFVLHSDDLSKGRVHTLL